MQLLTARCSRSLSRASEASFNCQADAYFFPRVSLLHPRHRNLPYSPSVGALTPLPSSRFILCTLFSQFLLPLVFRFSLSLSVLSRVIHDEEQPAKWTKLRVRGLHNRANIFRLIIPKRAYFQHFTWKTSSNSNIYVKVYFFNALTGFISFRNLIPVPPPSQYHRASTLTLYILTRLTLCVTGHSRMVSSVMYLQLCLCI